MAVALFISSTHYRGDHIVDLFEHSIADTSMTEMDGYNPFKGKAPGNPDFFPYGKPGGGAPMLDGKGKYSLQRHRVDFAHERDSSAEIGKRRRAADEYLHELSEYSVLHQCCNLK